MTVEALYERCQTDGFGYIEMLHSRTLLRLTLGYRSPAQFEAMAYTN